MSPVRYDGGTRGRMRHQNAQHRLLLCCCYCCCHAGMTWLTPEGRDLGVCQTTTETWRLPCDKRRVIGFIDLQPPNCITASAQQQQQQQPTYWTTQATHLLRQATGLVGLSVPLSRRLWNISNSHVHIETTFACQLTNENT